MVSDEDVQRLARRGRVAPHPSYHAHQHAIRFDEIVAGLCWCYRVEEDERDHRAAGEGREDRPRAYVAWCPYKGTRGLRVDLELQERADGDLILVVTAFEVASVSREVEDPDGGRIEIPEAYVDEETFEARIGEARQALGGPDQRLWPPGETFACPACGEQSFEGRSDLTYRATRGHHVVSLRHLHGASCHACGAKTLEPYEQVEVEDETGVGFHPDYEASVSRIGSGSLGTYWPKDVQRVLDLDPDKKAFIEIIDRDAVLVRFREDPEA